MARLSLKAAAARLSEPHWEAMLRIPGRPPQGYTANTVVTEWMTLNCAGDWASASLGAGRVRVWWFSGDDHRRARARFAPNSAWRAPEGRATDGFRFPA